MRILHTSDWHLGQHFMGKTRQAEHQAFCAWLIEQVREGTLPRRGFIQRMVALGLTAGRRLVAAA